MSKLLSSSLGSFSISILFIALSLNSCSQQAKKKTKEDLYLFTGDSKIYYDLNNPKEKFFLPYVLEEVSGLSCINKNTLVMVEDEGGKVYVYDIKVKELTRKISFSKPGDFEGISVVSDTAYIAKSNGKIYQFRIDSSDRVETIVTNTPLSKENDVEGLGYNPVKNALLLITKSHGDLKGYKVKGKSIYEYALSTNKFLKDTHISISNDSIMNFLNRKKGIEYDTGQRIRFGPSGIAFHPIEQTYYIISANNRMMIVMTTEGKIKATYPIRTSVLLQPEGICFLPNGDLIISSEGQGEKGYLLRFEMLTK